MFYLLGGAYAERAPGAWVTPGYIPGFGVRAALGRVLVASDFDAGRPMVAMISHQLWQSRFGGDPRIPTSSPRCAWPKNGSALWCGPSMRRRRASVEKGSGIFLGSAYCLNLETQWNQDVRAVERERS